MDKIKEKNIEECLKCCLSLSNDPKFHELIQQASHEERVCFLLDQGFCFSGLSQKEHRILEKMYRAKVLSQQMTKTAVS